MGRVFTKHWADYELLDAGNDKKLERWGEVITIRPDRNAYFKSVWTNKKWYDLAHFEFKEETSTKGEWHELKIGTSKSWQISYQSLKFNLKLTQFKHVGVFPEQRANWDFISKQAKPNGKFLNLFAYTGGASLAANANGANTFHCDSIRQINNWAKENMESSDQSNIHWVLEDAVKFAQREVKRGNTYQGIIMDPPAFGLGAKKERWKIEQRFPILIKLAAQLLKPDGFLIVNTYSPRLSIDKIQSIVHEHFQNKKVEVDKLCVKTTTGKVIEYGELTRVY